MPIFSLEMFHKKRNAQTCKENRYLDYVFVWWRLGGLSILFIQGLIDIEIPWKWDADTREEEEEEQMERLGRRRRERGETEPVVASRAPPRTAVEYAAVAAICRICIIIIWICGALPSLLPSPCFTLSLFCVLFAELMKGWHVADAPVLIGWLPICSIFKEVVVGELCWSLAHHKLIAHVVCGRIFLLIKNK